MSRALLPAALLTGLLLAGCLPDVELDGKGCDVEHPCIEGFHCRKERCVRIGSVEDIAEGAVDGGAAADGG